MEGKELALLGEISRLYLEKRTGELMVKGPKFEKRVFFEQGRIIFAVSNLEQDSLGNILVDTEKITPDDLLEAEKTRHKEGGALGTVLVWMGLLSAEDLYWGIRFQATRIIYSLFKLEEDFNYSFAARPLGAREVLRLNFQTPNIIMEAARRIGSASTLLTQLRPQSYVCFSMDHELGKALDFLPKEKEILPLLNGRYTVKKLIGLGLMEDLELLRMLHGLRTLRMLILAEEAIHAETAPAAPPPPALEHPAVPDSAGHEAEEFLAQEALEVSSLARRRLRLARLRWAAIILLFAALGAALVWRFYPAALAAVWSRTARNEPPRVEAEQEATPAPVPPQAQTAAAPSQSTAEAPGGSPDTEQPTADVVEETPGEPSAPAQQGTADLLVDQFTVEGLGRNRYRVRFRLANAGPAGSERLGYLFVARRDVDGKDVIVHPAMATEQFDARVDFRRGDSFRIARYRLVQVEFEAPSAPSKIRVVAFDREGKLKVDVEPPVEIR
ncbi:MAG: DUF4388 domain-containing protein [Acidobacteriota bacterium]